MASFSKRGKTWQYVISAKPKPIRKGGFKTKKEAQIAAAEIESELSKGAKINLKPMPLNEYFEEWVKLYKTNLSKGTTYHYGYTLKSIDDHFGSKPIQEITKRDYQAFMNEFGKTRAKETIDKVNMHIRSCVKDAIDEGLIRIDFTRKVVITAGKESKKKEEKHLNFKESELVIKEALKRLDHGLSYYIILLGMTSGMRFAEMVGLTRKDFDFKRNTITINKSWGHLKKMHDGFGKTKTIDSERVISMDPNTMAIFKDLFIKTPENTLKLIFFSPSSKYKVISNNAVNKTLKHLLDNLGIQTITAHGMRHTHGSVLLYKKASIDYVSERLGHKDVEITFKTYSHILKEKRKEDDQLTVNIFKGIVSFV